MAKITTNDIRRELSAYGILPAPVACEKIQLYIGLLLAWNKKISLTKYVDPIEIIKFHFGESLFVLNSLQLAEGTLADVGSGAGFPGLPIALLSSSLDVSLIEANGKKAAFLSEVVRRLGLRNVKVLNTRMEDAKASPFLDFVTVRAVAQTEELFGWAKRSLAKGGKLVLWVGDEGTKNSCQIKGWQWAAPVLIPGSQKRYIVVGSPIID
jgi:16S rRNA (guanine527-N7)-methyltransferase